MKLRMRQMCAAYVWKKRSKSYKSLKNVNFANTKLYRYHAGAAAFGTYGDNTYYVYICKPEDIRYSYGTNSETVSIVYNE